MEKKELKITDYETCQKPTWCPGCGDFSIWQAIKRALLELEIKPHKAVISYGIGCAGNMANNLGVYGFHSLHGRSLPIAVGIKLANHNLTVLAISGDGDAYGEGTNHLIHAARANSNVTHIVCNNHSYSLTTGQSSPTSTKGYISKTTPWGEVKEPVNPMALALASGASFVARGFAGDIEQLTDIIKKGIKHEGYSHIDVLQHCVTWNQAQTIDYLRKKVYKLEDEKDYNNKNKQAAFAKAIENNKLAIGVFYQKKRPSFEKTFLQLGDEPLVKKELRIKSLNDLI